MANLHEEFEKWLRAAFIKSERPERFWDVQVPEVINHCLILFLDVRTIVAPFSRTQQGDAFIKIAAHCMPFLSHPRVPAETRAACTAAIFNLFRDLFQVDSLDNTCSFWFEGMFMYEIMGYSIRDDPRTVSGLIQVQRKILSLDSEECQRSALYGLGLFVLYDSADARHAIDEFLNGPRQLKPEVAAYARLCRTGGMI